MNYYFYFIGDFSLSSNTGGNTFIFKAFGMRGVVAVLLSG